jgi:signal transduction histidine kinase
MQIEESLRQYTERLNILRELDRTILETQSSQGVVQAALHHIHRLVTCQLARVILINKDTQEFQVWINDGQDTHMIQAGQHFPPATLGEEADYLLWQGATALLEDSSSFNCMPYTVAATDERSILDVPLTFQHELVGVLTLVADNPEAFGDVQTETACDVANQLAIAIRQSRLHEQIQHHAIELEERVEERTAELQAANARLQVLSRAKDEFVSNVSHELRTPITNIKLYQELMSKRTDKYEHYSATLRRETVRLESLIEALLMLSRLDQDREKFLFAPIDLNQMLKQFVVDRETLAATKGITLALEVEPETVMIEADQRLLEQVLSILLTNALAYTPPDGHVTVRSAKRMSHGQLWVGFSISDTGLGISADEQEHLFERFFRGNAGHASNVPGTGLGLAIAKEIIDRHKGQIEVYSEVGEGTVFSVWLTSE